MWSFQTNVDLHLCATWTFEKAKIHFRRYICHSITGYHSQVLSSRIIVAYECSQCSMTRYGYMIDIFSRVHCG